MRGTMPKILNTQQRKVRNNPFEPWRRKSSETRVWLAVIINAFEDALRYTQNKEQQNQKIAAQIWLTNLSRDFVEVCTLADVNPHWIIRKAKVRIAQGHRVHLPAGMGTRFAERKRYREKVKANKAALQGSSSETASHPPESSSSLAGLPPEPSQEHEQSV